MTHIDQSCVDVPVILNYQLINESSCDLVGQSGSLFVSHPTLMQMIFALMSSRLDYCNRHWSRRCVLQSSVILPHHSARSPLPCVSPVSQVESCIRFKCQSSQLLYIRDRLQRPRSVSIYVTPKLRIMFGERTFGMICLQS